MRVLGSSVLIFEAIVIGLFVPVALTTGTVADGRWIGWGAALLVLGCLAAVAGLGRGWGVGLGWVIQGWIVATGVVVPLMFVVGGLFALLWWAAVHYGRQADGIRAGYAAAQEGRSDGGAGEDAGGSTDDRPPAPGPDTGR